MPDRTHPSGLMNLRDPYDTENYYSEEFMQENLNKALGFGFDPQWSEFLRTTQPGIFDLDPNSDEYRNQIGSAVDTFVKNKYDYEEAGSLFDRNQQLIDNTAAINRLKKDYKDMSWVEKLNYGTMQEQAYINNLITPVGSDMIDYMYAGSKDPSLYAHSALNVGEDIIDFGTGLAMVIPNVYFNEQAKTDFNQALMGTNVPEGGNYWMNLLDQTFSQGKIAGVPELVDEVTNYMNYHLQEVMGVPEEHMSRYMAPVQRGADYTELAVFLASPGALNAVIRAPYKLAEKGIVKVSGAMNRASMGKQFDARIAWLQKSDANLDQYLALQDEYIRFIRANFDPRVAAEIIKLETKRFNKNPIILQEMKKVQNQTTAEGIPMMSNVKEGQVVNPSFAGVGGGGKATTILKKRNPEGGPLKKIEVETALLDRAASMYKGEGVTWADLTQGQKDHLFDKRGIGPKIDIEQGIINPEWKPTFDDPVYGGPLAADIAYTKELDAAAAYQSNGQKKYSDYLTEPQREAAGLPRGTPEARKYIRDKFMKDGKFVGPASEGKQSNIKAVSDELKNKIKRRYELFVERHGRLPYKAELHQDAFGVLPGQGLDHSKIIDNMVKDGILDIEDYTEVRRIDKIGLKEKYQYGEPMYEAVYKDIVDKAVERFGISKEEVGNIFIRGHSLREKYYDRVPVELQELVMRPAQLLTSGQNSRHIAYEDQIIFFFDKKEEMMDLRRALNKGEELSAAQIQQIEDVASTFGVTHSKDATIEQKLKAALDGIKKNLEQTDNAMIADNVYTPMYDPTTNKLVIFGQSAGSKYDPFDPKKPKSDQLRTDPKIEAAPGSKAQVMPSRADVRESYRRLIRKIEGETTPDGQPLKDGGTVKPKRGLVDEPGGYAGEEEFGVFAKYLENKRETVKEQNMFESLPESQKYPMAVFLSDQEKIDRERIANVTDPGVRYKLEKKDYTIDRVKAAIAEEMVDKKPLKFKWSSLPKIITQNPLFKQQMKMNMMPSLILASILGQGKEQNIDLPKTEGLLQSYVQLGPTPATDPEAAYIDVIDEINRAQETGFRNLTYNTMDLVLAGIDLAAFGKTDLQSKLNELYEKTDKNDPETFLGDMVSLLVEFGVPGGLVTKILTRAQKALRLKGVNTMTRYIDDDVVGAARFGMQVSNVAKRMGTGAAIFGATDFIAGGPYNSLYRMFEDPTLLPGTPIDTKDLKGDELAVANFKNRVRFAGDGAVIGGLFPLVGPAVMKVAVGAGKLPFKTIPGINRSVFGGALQLAGIPLKIAADTIAGKIPYTPHNIPVLGTAIQKTGQFAAQTIQETAKFLGKQVFARGALGIYDLAYAKQAAYSGIKYGPTFSRKLPKFEEWRKFSVNSQDPLHQFLARIDNKLAAFRDIGKLTKDAFGISTQTDLFIKAKSRVVDKYLRSIERTAYKMAKAFEERHQRYGEYQTIQKKYLDDVLDYLQGEIKSDALPPKLRELAKELKKYTNDLKQEFGEMLPTTDPIKYLLSSNIDKYMRRSFAMFTNSSFQPGREAVLNAKEFVKDLIRKDSGLFRQAEEAFPDQPIAKAIDDYAELKVADIMHTARYELDDPFRALEKIAKKLNLDDLKIVTGEEVPVALRKLLGEEKNLKSSLLQTTGNMIASTQQKRALDEIAKMGLEGGWLFRSAEEALGKGKILNPARLDDIKTQGFLPNDAIGMFGTPELIRQLGGYSIFDSALKYKIYQNILAFKAMVQGGKTLYSPATQMRNFGSASLFAMNVGHIGGSASVPQAFKMVLDDVFGAGPNVDRNKLIKYIERKVELGVIDENVVANELAGILADLKGTRTATGEPIISGFNQFLQRVGNTELSQYVQRTYAGGDNVWKMYGHEFYMSELAQFTKSIADVKKYFKDIIGRDFIELSPKTGINKTVAEGIEEMAAHLVRETYPTYSRVPPVVQALRKLPLGNFISFPAEMLRTSATTLSTSLKHIASGNPGLQAMGYRSLFGQFTTLYGANEAIKATGHALTDVTPAMVDAYLGDLGPGFMQNHILVPITNKDPKTGIFKAFDLSTYNPYAYVTDPVKGFIREINQPRLTKDIEGEVYNRIFDAAGPLMALIEPFTTETIALEPMFDIWARQGRARDGKLIFSKSDDFGEKVSKSFNHILETIAPGFIRSAGQVMGALSLDTKGGRVMELGDVLLRLLGGSVMNVDPVNALDYKALDIREIRSDAFKTEHFFSKENALERGPKVMAAEFRDIQEEALQAQFEVWKMFNQALSSGLLTEKQIEKVLGPDGRNVPNLDNLLDGKFTPVSFSESGLEQRADELYKEYKRNGITVNKRDLKPFYELRKVIREMRRIEFKDLLDPERDQMAPPPKAPATGFESLISQAPAKPQVPPLQNTPVPDASTIRTASMQNVNPQTGLTPNEDALLSPTEKLIQQRSRGMA